MLTYLIYICTSFIYTITISLYTIEYLFIYEYVYIIIATVYIQGLNPIFSKVQDVHTYIDQNAHITSHITSQELSIVYLHASFIYTLITPIYIIYVFFSFYIFIMYMLFYPYSHLSSPQMQVKVALSLHNNITQGLGTCRGPSKGTYGSLGRSACRGLSGSLDFS